MGASAAGAAASATMGVGATAAPSRAAGAAGVAGLLTLRQEPAFAALGLARDSRVMVVLSEQAVAPA